MTAKNVSRKCHMSSERQVRPELRTTALSIWASQVVLVLKNPPANAGDLGSIPGWGRPPGIGNGIPLQYSCLENPMDRGSWWATVHRTTKSELKWPSRPQTGLSSLWWYELLEYLYFMTQMYSLWGRDSVSRIRWSKMKALENVKESKIIVHIIAHRL